MEPEVLHFCLLEGASSQQMILLVALCERAGRNSWRPRLIEMADLGYHVLSIFPTQGPDYHDDGSGVIRALSVKHRTFIVKYFTLASVSLFIIRSYNPCILLSCCILKLEYSMATDIETQNDALSRHESTVEKALVDSSEWLNLRRVPDKLPMIALLILVVEVCPVDINWEG